MTEQEFNTLYRDPAARKAVFLICLRWWRGNEARWKQDKYPAFEVADLESEAWIKILAAPGGNLKAYYYKVADNYLKSRFAIAKARREIAPRVAESKAYIRVEGAMTPMTEVLYSTTDDEEDNS